MICSKTSKPDNRGFTLLELIIVISIIAILVGVIAPGFMGNIEKSRRAKDLYNVKSIMNVLELAYIDGSVSFSENSGQSAVWVFVNGNKAQFYANGAVFPVVNGIQDIQTQNQFRQLLKDNGVDSDKLKVNAKSAKDTGVCGTEDGWKWYCVYLLSDGTIRAVSAPGNAGDEYISSWGSFRSKILNWSDKEQSAIARAVVR